MSLKAPFPWMGGKSRAAHVVWDAFGDIDNFVEPFAGSLAVLLHQPYKPERTETVNDLDGMIANLWRSIAHCPDEVAYHADWPVNENDQHARHVWLVNQRAELTARLEGDPTWHDPLVAGWWLWGICCWIGSGWCSGDGPWKVDDEGKLVHLGDDGRGVHRQLVHLGDDGRGVHRQLVHLGDEGQEHGDGALLPRVDGIYRWMRALADRLRRVRVCCGDWTRVLGPTVTVKQGLTGVFLDPPYDTNERTPDLYAMDSGTVAADVRAWCAANGDNPMLRIVLAGYDTEHGDLDDLGWRRVTWKAKGGYGSQRKSGDNQNRHREVLWLSPHCQAAGQPDLFGGLSA